jgi:4,5:9,10-diseco-3-hydroxy-5,9,17-trioxoandrosta-1(10),2-diene-4-oate hydrolase
MSDGKFIDVNGVKIHYHDVGAGKPVILIHGGGPGAGGLSNYRRNMDAIAKRARALVIDLPGYGQSENKRAPGGIFVTLAEMIVGFMDALGLHKADFIGNSLGGGTALMMALRYPDRVGKMVLMGTAGGLPVFSPFPTEGLVRMFTFYDGDGPSIEKLRKVLELLIFDQSAITQELLEERLKAATRPDVISNPPLRAVVDIHLSDEMWRERMPAHETLLVWGRDDRVVPLDAAFILLKTMPNAQLHVFPKCGHWAQWEKADAFNDLVCDFLGLR